MEDDNYERKNSPPATEEELVPTFELEEISTTDMLPPVPSKCRRLSYVMTLTLFSGIGSCLFGYGTGVVSGAMIKVDKVFSLTYLWHELIVSVTVGAAAVGALIGGPLSDLLGRRMVLIISSVIFTLGAILLAASVAKEMLLVGRLVVGVGIGLVSVTVPIYIAESAPSKIRGKLVVLNIAFITGGLFLASLVSGIFSNDSWSWGWRVMFGLAGVPSVIMFFGMIFMPESPRWLVFHNKKEKAVKILRKMRTEEEADEEMEAIVKEYEEHQKLKLGVFQFAKKLFTTRTVVLALVVGCGLQMFQQLSGINAIIYYSGNIIELAGFPGDAAIWLTCIPTFGNFVFTFIGEVLVDKLGRRKLVLGSVAGVIVSLLAISGVFHLLNERSLLVNSPYPNVTCHHDRCLYCVADESCGFCAAFNSSTDTYKYGTCSAVSDSSNFGYFVGNNESVVTCGALSPMNSSQSDTMTVGELRWSKDSCTHDSIAPLAVVCLVLYLVFFAPGLAPVPWTVNSEIYPTWARGFGVSISSTVNWVINLFVSLTFLSLLDTLSPAVGFLMFAGFSIMAFIFIFLLLPETKKKSLEETGDLFRQPYFLRWCRNMRRYRRLHNVN